MTGELRDLHAGFGRTAADLGALFIHVGMILATSEHFEGEFAPTKEAFTALESACVSLAGRGSP